MTLTSRPTRALVVGLALSALLSACGGGDDPLPRAGGATGGAPVGSGAPGGSGSSGPLPDGSPPASGTGEGGISTAGGTGGVGTSGGVRTSEGTGGGATGGTGAAAQPGAAGAPRASVGAGPPAKVLFGVVRQAVGGPPSQASVMTAFPDGSARARRDSAQPFPLTQVSRGVVVTTTLLTRTGEVPAQQGIVLRKPDRSQQVLTRGGYDDAPAWSPDGRAIAYRSRVGEGSQQRSFVRLLDRSGKDGGALSAPPAGQTDGPPVWAPDGRSIATVRTTVSGQRVTSRIVLLTFDGKAPKTLVEGEYSDLAFAPDGRTLAAVKAEGAVRKDVWIVDLGGRGAKQVTAFAQPGGVGEVVVCGRKTKVVPAVALPVWSPDGRSVAYLSSYPHIREGSQQADVEVVDVADKTYTTAYAVPKATCPPKGEPQTYQRSRLYGWVRS